MNIPLETTCEIISKQTITSFNYRVTDIILFKSATIFITFCDENNFCFKGVQYVVEGEEYANWKDDDQYIIDLITSKIPDLIK